MSRNKNDSVSSSRSGDYSDRFSRNIGIISAKDQEILREAKVSLFGLGGIGGPAFEVLVRTGIGNFVLIDNDRFDVSNMNRQIYAYDDSIGKKKTDVAKKRALQINPDVHIETYEQVTEDSIEEIIHGSDGIVLGIDELKACIIISRKARELDIPLVEGWGIPYGNVRMISNKTPSLEEMYGLETLGRPVESIGPQELRETHIRILKRLRSISGMHAYYTRDAFDAVNDGGNPSFAPHVWLTSVMMAFEIIKYLLGQGTSAEGNDFKLYDPFSFQMVGSDAGDNAPIGEHEKR